GYINLLFEFYLATAAWINNLAVCMTEEEAAQGFKQIEELKDFKANSPTQGLRWVPEFIVENIIDFMLFLRSFDLKPKVKSIQADLEPLMTMIVIFMGSPHRMR